MKSCGCWTARRTLCMTGKRYSLPALLRRCPKITIAKAPNGKSGATSYLPVNLLTGKRTDSYRGTEETKAETVYYLSFNALTDTAVTAQVLQADGSWAAKAEGTDFTVDRPLGKVTFKTAPGKSPVDGEDNVRSLTRWRTGPTPSTNAGFVFYTAFPERWIRVFAAGSPDGAERGLLERVERPRVFWGCFLQYPRAESSRSWDTAYWPTRL